MPRASCHSCSPTTLPMEISTSLRVIAASCPMVSTPMDLSFAPVTGPTPHNLFTARGCSISSWRSAGITKVPSGFASPDPILANCLPDPAPMEHGRPVSSRMSARSSSAQRLTSSALAPSKEAGSIKASSIESCSITSTCCAMMPKTRRDAAEYTARRGCTTTARSPTSCCARYIGMAECAPYTRAS